MRILFVSSFLLFKETRFGGAKRLYNIARELQKKNDLSLICFDGCQESRRFSEQPAEFRRLLYLPFDRPGIVSRFLRISIDHRTILAAHQHEIADFLGQDPFDVICLAFASSLNFIQGFPHLHSRRIVYVEDDLHIERYRVLFQNRTLPLYMRIWKYYRYCQLLTYYRSRLRHVNTFVAISPQEEQVMRAYFPFLSTAIISYGVDPLEYPMLGIPANRAVIGYIGNFRHPPNIDAVEYLLGTLCPHARTQGITCSVVIAGKDIPSCLRERFVGQPDIVWMEDVAEVREFYGSIALFVNPVVSYRGLRTKLVEAAAFGRPALSTKLGAEGLENLGCDIFTTPDEFAGFLRQHIEDEAYYCERRNRSRLAFEEQYTQEAVAGKLMDVLRGKNHLF